MAVETHWICDVCSKRIVKSSQTEDRCESEIKDWFVVNLRISKVANPITEKAVYKFGYACSRNCLKEVISWLKKLAEKEILKEVKL